MTPSGTIIARLFTSQARLPVPGAIVAFHQPGPEGRRTLLGARISDLSGRTVPLRVAAPARSEGISPGGAVPFALCDVWAEAPGFEYSVAEDVQIFPGIETVLDIELVPLPQTRASAANTEVTQITPQGL